MPHIPAYAHNGVPKAPRFVVPRQMVLHEIGSWLAFLEQNEPQKAADHLRKFNLIATDLVARSQQHIAQHAARHP